MFIITLQQFSAFVRVLSGFYINKPDLYDITEQFLMVLNTHNPLTGNSKLRTENVLIVIII